MILRKMKPVFLENSRLPVVLSKLAPININAIALFPFVFAMGTLTETSKRHETIHFQQQLETGVIGFYIIYLWDYVRNLRKGMSGKEAYFDLRAEREAYHNQADEEYLIRRKRYVWLKGGKEYV